MKKYRKKEIVIEAVQLTIDNIEKVAKWCKGQIKGIKLPLEERVIDIQILEGEIRANYGDWILKSLKEGFAYVCSPTKFEAIYEEVNNV